VVAVLLVISVLAAQGIPVQPNQGGTVTGVLRTATGAPAVSVRVSALSRPEELTDLAQATSLAGIALTDAAGRFRLENIPPGRYYVVAGNVDVPTYYPGVVAAKDATVIQVTPGATVPGIDFMLNNASAGRALGGLLGGILSSGPILNPSFVIPVQTRVDGGGQIPYFADGWFPTLRLARTDRAPIETALIALNITVPEKDYRATVENLPEGYALKSFTFGTTDLKTNALQLGSVVSVSPTNNLATLPVPQGISIVLQRLPAVRREGVRISGQIRSEPTRSIYISGRPGTVYADGTFEFIGVLPGRHTVVTLDNPGRGNALGASIVVGTGDVPNLELEQISLVPVISGPSDAALAGGLAPNTRLPLATIRGRVIDAMSGQPLDAGKVVVNNDHSATVSLDSDGRFEVTRLLPGNYVLEIAAYGVGVISRSITLDEKDASVEVRVGAEQ
jgi:hypothetical protein